MFYKIRLRILKKIMRKGLLREEIERVGIERSFFGIDDGNIPQEKQC